MGLLKKARQTARCHSERSEESRFSSLFGAPDPSRALRMTPKCTFSTAPVSPVYFGFLMMPRLDAKFLLVPCLFLSSSPRKRGSRLKNGAFSVLLDSRLRGNDAREGRVTWNSRIIRPKLVYNITRGRDGAFELCRLEDRGR